MGTLWVREVVCVGLGLGLGTYVKIMGQVWVHARYAWT